MLSIQRSPIPTPRKRKVPDGPDSAEAILRAELREAGSAGDAQLARALACAVMLVAKARM